MKNNSLISLLSLLALALCAGCATAPNQGVVYMPLVPSSALRGFQQSAVDPAPDAPYGERLWITPDPIMDIRGCQVSALYTKVNPVDGHLWLVNDPSDPIPN